MNLLLPASLDGSFNLLLHGTNYDSSFKRAWHHLAVEIWYKFHSLPKRSTNQQSLHNTNSYTSYTYFHNEMCLANFGVKYPNPPSLVDGLVTFKSSASSTLNQQFRALWNSVGLLPKPFGDSEINVEIPKDSSNLSKGATFCTQPLLTVYRISLGPWHVGVVSNAIP